MATYLVTPLAGNHVRIGEALQRLAGVEIFRLQNNAGFLVEFNGTSVDLGQQSRITEPDGPGSALITAITSYYGRGPTDMWEWLKVKIEGR